MSNDSTYTIDDLADDLYEPIICGQYKEAIKMIAEHNYELDQLLGTLLVLIGIGKVMTLIAVMQNEGYIVIDKDYNKPKVEKISEVLLEEDLGVNFNGYPLENEYDFADKVREVIGENQARRFHKNRSFKLKLVVEEYR